MQLLSELTPRHNRNLNSSFRHLPSRESNRRPETVLPTFSANPNWITLVFVSLCQLEEKRDKAITIQKPKAPEASSTESFLHSQAISNIKLTLFVTFTRISYNKKLVCNVHSFNVILLNLRQVCSYTMGLSPIVLSRASYGPLPS